MPSVSLRGHFDGKHIVLDEPFHLAPNSPLIITVLTESERAGWAGVAAQALARAYGDSEPEYTPGDLKRP